MTKATDTVTPEAIPLTLLGHNSPSSSQGMVPTPAPNTETQRFNSRPVSVIVIVTTEHIEDDADSRQDVQHQLHLLKLRALGVGGVAFRTLR